MSVTVSRGTDEVRLAALSAYGLFLGYMVHRDTLARGREVLAVREAEVREQEQQTSILEAREQALAEAAAATLQK